MVLRLIDLEGNHYPAEASTGIDEELNADSMLSVTFQSTRTNDRFLSDMSELWRISGVKGPSDDTEYVINFLTRQGIGDKMVAHIRAIPKMFDDLAKYREYERFDQSFTAQNFFTLVFKDTPYTFVLLDSFGALRFEGLGEGDQKIEMFMHGVNRYGIEFEIVGNEVRMRKRVERNVPYQLRWRLNASNIQEEIDATGFVTYAKGYGDYGDGEGGEDWQDAKLIREYTSPLAQIPGIGIRHAQPIKNGNITDVNTMDDNLKTLVDESLKVSVTADFHRLKNYPYAEPRKGDLIHLIDERINFKRKVRVIKVLTYRDSKGNITKQDVTFGDVGITKRHQAKINTAVNTVDRIMEGRQKIPFSVLDEAVLAATKALQNAQTELVFPESGGIHAVDKTDPNKMVVFNSAGLGITNDGGQSFRTAITGDGIVADVITAGVLRGIDIIGTNIMSFNPVNNNVITLENGEIDTFVDGNRRFGIHGNGLVAYHWVTEDEVATFRAEHINNERFGASIMGEGDYFAIGKGIGDGNTNKHFLSFNWDRPSGVNHDRTFLYGGSGLSDSGLLMLRSTQMGGSAGELVPELIIDNRTTSGTAYSGVRAYVGRDNRSPSSSNFRSGFEVWQYTGNGNGGVHRFLEMDTNSSGDRFVDFWVDQFYVQGNFSTDGTSNLHGHLDLNNWNILNVSDIAVSRIRANESSGRFIDVFNNDPTVNDTSYAGLTLRRAGGYGGVHFHTSRGMLTGGTSSNFAVLVAGSDSTSGFIQSTNIRDRSYSGSANVYVTVNGILGNVSSARRYKTLIEPMKVDHYKILDIIPSDWYDKVGTEAFARYLSNKDTMNIDEEDIPYLRRIPGAIAEDFIDVGLDVYVTYNNDGDVQSLMYDRAWLSLVPITKDHEDRLNEYDDRFDSVESRIEKLENELKQLKEVA